MHIYTDVDLHTLPDHYHIPALINIRRMMYANYVKVLNISIGFP